MKSFWNSSQNTTSSRCMLLLCAVIFAQALLPTEFSSPLIVLFGLSVLIVAGGRTSRGYLMLVRPLLGVAIIGIFGVTNHLLRDILRDISFALAPISLIFIGYWMADNGGRWHRILKVLVICGVVLAGLHLSAFIQNPALFTADMDEVRRTAGGAGSLVVLSLVLGLFQYRLGIGNLFPKFLPRVIALPMLLVSFVLSYSRTEFIVALILLLALWGVLAKVNLRMMLAVSVLVIGFFTLTLTTPKGEEGTFRSKLARSLTEMTVSNYQDQQDINDNWRGFETSRVLASFSSGNLLQQIFGRGFGSLTDLGFYMKLGGREFRYIPILHNGYAYILIKTGIVGILLYAIFYIKVIRSAVRFSNSKNTEHRFLSRLLMGCVLALILTMSVIGGMAQAAEPAFVLLLGYLTRRIGQIHSVTSRQETVLNAV